MKAKTLVSSKALELLIKIMIRLQREKQAEGNARPLNFLRCSISKVKPPRNLERRDLGSTEFLKDARKRRNTDTR